MYAGDMTRKDAEDEERRLVLWTVARMDILPIDASPLSTNLLEEL